MPISSKQISELFKAGPNVSIYSGTGLTLTISATTSSGGTGGSFTGVTGFTSIGGGISIPSAITSNNLLLKSLSAGTNVSITDSNGLITINSTGTGSTSGFTNIISSGTGNILLLSSNTNNIIQKSFSGGPNVSVYESNNTIFISATTSSGGTGGSFTGVTGFTSIGGGISIPSAITLNNISFKSLSGGPNVTVYESNGLIRISGAVDSGVNVGGGISVYSATSNSIHSFKTLSGGPNVTVYESNGLIRFSGTVDSGVNVGGGISVYSATSNSIHSFKTLSAGTNVSLTESNGLIIISSSGGGGGSGDMILASAQTITGAKTFLVNTFLLRNTLNLFSATINVDNILANRTYTIPEISSNATFALLEGSQLFTGSKTFGTTLNISGANANNPHFILTPTSSTPTSTTNGSFWLITTSANTSLVMYKDTGYTKTITLDRNLDFSGNSSGVILSDQFGNLSKSTDIIPFGLFNTISDVTTTSTSSATTIGTLGTGSLTLDSTFFAVGKTIRLTSYGKLSTSLSSSVITFTLFIGSASWSIVTPTLTSSLTDSYYKLEFLVTCRTTGATANLIANGDLYIDAASGSKKLVPTTASTNTTTSNTINITSTWSSSSQSITTSMVIGEFLN
jgi:hypothetical protein